MNSSSTMTVDSARKILKILTEHYTPETVVGAFRERLKEHHEHGDFTPGIDMDDFTTAKEYLLAHPVVLPVPGPEEETGDQPKIIADLWLLIVQLTATTQMFHEQHTGVGNRQLTETVNTLLELGVYRENLVAVVEYMSLDEDIKLSLTMMCRTIEAERQLLLRETRVFQREYTKQKFGPRLDSMRYLYESFEILVRRLNGLLSTLSGNRPL